MKRMIPIVLSMLAVSAGAFAQAPDQATIDTALLAATGAAFIQVSLNKS